jgi:hypothetical protein
VTIECLVKLRRQLSLSFVLQGTPRVISVGVVGSKSGAHVCA